MILMDHLTLLELNQKIKETLDANLQPSYWVVAEIGEIRTHHSGHCYLELVEKSDDKVVAKSRATIWSYTFRNLSVWFEGMTGQPLKKGLKILCNASVQYHELYGLSLNIRDIDASYTLGERARRRQEIINQLIAEGVFNLNKELTLPVVAQRIAVISSPTAAGFGDFVDQITNNVQGYDIDLKLFKAKMQGDDAAESIINSLLSINNSPDKFDLVVIIRGGGSQIDLDCFDDYELALHAAQFPLPVLTGIGHERDETIVDLVAHTKLKTPTAVAEFLLGGMAAFDEKMDLIFSRLYQLTNESLKYQDQMLATFTQRMTTSSSRILSTKNTQISLLEKELKFVVQNRLNQDTKRLEVLEKALDLLDPEKAFNRGYTLTTARGKLIKGRKINAGDILETHTIDQKITSTVTGITDRHD